MSHDITQCLEAEQKIRALTAEKEFLERTVGHGLVDISDLKDRLAKSEERVAEAEASWGRLKDGCVILGDKLAKAEEDGKIAWKTARAEGDLADEFKKERDALRVALNKIVQDFKCVCMVLVQEEKPCFVCVAKVALTPSWLSQKKGHKHTSDCYNPNVNVDDCDGPLTNDDSEGLSQKCPACNDLGYEQFPNFTNIKCRKCGPK